MSNIGAGCTMCKISVEQIEEQIGIRHLEEDIIADLTQVRFMVIQNA